MDYTFKGMEDSLVSPSKGSGMNNVMLEIVAERQRAIQLALEGNTEEFDKMNSQNDWVAYVMAYAGRAADKVFRNQREKCEFREMMVKAGALCLAAIEAYDKGYCPPY